ncbi:MAG: M48 family metalloprotease [Tenericutes bacterium]|nr:M48 family metalloprotease [Mycoplasmatota bacterium]
MKKIKVQHYLFIFLNVLGLVLEYFVMYKYLFMTLIGLSSLISFILVSVILFVLLFLTIYANKKTDHIFEEEDVDKISTFHLEATKKIRKKFMMNTSKDIKIQFVDGIIQPSVMFALMGNVFINTNKLYNYRIINDVHFEGVLSHELGHVLHMPNIYFIANLRPTAILGNFLFVLTYNLSRILSKKKNKELNYFIFSLVYILFILMNLLNLIILYPFKRYEELQADKLSLQFSNGYSLRGYYYKLYFDHQSQLDQFRFKYIDLNHPTPFSHYKKLNQYIIKTNDNCEFISHNKILVKEFKDNEDRLGKMIKFYELYGDKSIISMYLYIAKIYEEYLDLEKAKEYYLLAGKNDIFTGYRRLIKILKAEGNVENVLEYYKILAKNGDKDANLYLNYYEKDFGLYKVIKDAEEFEVEKGITLKLLFNDTYQLKVNEIEISGKFTRRRNTVKIFSDDTNYIEYYFKEGEIVSKKYSITNSENELLMNIKEMYH